MFWCVGLRLVFNHRHYLRIRVESASELIVLGTDGKIEEGGEDIKKGKMRREDRRGK